ncbi:MAG: rod shape-determining protein [Patescibacteria group bacterium]|nr:rod shape-determining protein [Patescibacteria group bacterium]MDD4304454.1 rod shape-determining protein [Patescibacteria group bacterium]MDD4695476.1 rod shape-determining protein [Patescibacteria group bacterium]
MLKNFFGKFSKDIAVDLGTSNTLVYVKDKGIIINEPSVVAINTRTDQILSVGEDARRMLGKTPPHILAVQPLRSGIISDFEVTEKMMRYFIEKVHKESFSLVPRPRIIIGIPLDITEVERKAVEDVAISAGAREVFLIEQPMAAAIGSRLPIQEPNGNMIIEIGGGKTEIAVISLGGIVTSKSLKIAGEKLDNDIIDYIREKYNIFLGDRSAETAKIKVGNVLTLEKSLRTKCRGRNLLNGLPREIIVKSDEIRDAIKRSVDIIISAVKDVVEQTPPELVSDLYQRGMVISGGGAALRGLDKLIYEETKIPVTIADDSLTTVVRGIGMVLEDFDNLKELLLPPTVDKSYR